MQAVSGSCMEGFQPGSARGWLCWEAGVVGGRSQAPLPLGVACGSCPHAAGLGSSALRFSWLCAPSPPSHVSPAWGWQRPPTGADHVNFQPPSLWSPRLPQSPVFVWDPAWHWHEHAVCRDGPCAAMARRAFGNPKFGNTRHTCVHFYLKIALLEICSKEVIVQVQKIHV